MRPKTGLSVTGVNPLIDIDNMAERLQEYSVYNEFIFIRRQKWLLMGRTVKKGDN